MIRTLQLLRVGAIALALASVTSGCNHDNGQAQPSSAENITTPRWIYRDAQHPNPIAVVFVHGIFGDTIGTWRNRAGTTVFDYLHQAPGIGGKVDIYAFGFTSTMLAGGSLKIGEAANKLDDYLVRDGVDHYDQIVFVAHSMGGLVTMRTLILHPEIARRVPLLVFYATPHEGSQITNIAKYVVGNNPAVRQMLPVDANDYLQQLNEDWMQVRNTSPHPTMVCAYETKDTGPTRIVPWASGTRNCDEVASGIENSDHITIVKPDAASAHAMVVLEKALQQHVLPALDASTWDTPDIRDDHGKWTFFLKDVNERNPFIVANRGLIPQSYRLDAVDATNLLVTPETMPRSVEPGGRDEVGVVLIGDVQPQYRLRLRLGSTPERLVTARVADLGAAIASRNARTSHVAEHMNAYFDSADNMAHFQMLSPDAQQAELARLADEAVAQLAPDLPGGARMLVTADTLKTLNLSNSAAATLYALQERYPATARSTSARYLAGVVEARTGKEDVLGPVAVPRVNESEAVQPADLQSTSQAQRSELTQLADHLRTTPAIQAEATVLKGDVLQASGNSKAAARVYGEARTVEPAPVVKDRLRRAEEAHH